MNFSFKLLLTVTILALNYKTTTAQRERTVNWFFGENAGVHFSTTTLQINTLGQVNTDEGCSSISDSCGNLLFYTDGRTVYTKNHSIMQNGQWLYGDHTSTQSALIVPRPNNDSTYYIFTTSQANGYYTYSEVNMNANNGLGEVLNKNIGLHFTSTEKQAGIKHCNGQDVWVVTKGENAKNIYYSYLVTAAGVSQTPISSTVAFTPSFDLVGNLKFSPNGQYLADAYFERDSLFLHRFDPCTGDVIPFMSFKSDTGTYALSFSPDNTKLYASNTQYAPFLPPSTLVQYDITSGIPATILASKTVIYTLPPYQYFGALQLGPNDKIYATQFLYGANNTVPYLSTINSPNSTGTLCAYLNNNVSLNGKMGMLSLPNFIESYFNVNYSCYTQTSTPTGITENNLASNISIFPNPVIDKTLIKLNTGETMKQIDILDSFGKLVRSISNIHKKEVYFEKGQLETGIYLLIINTEKSDHKARLVIK